MMKSENVLREKSYAFAINVVLTCKQLVAEKKEFLLSKQLLRSGTAIGALIRESEFAQSKADFISKLSIALKEANETDYWLCLLKDTALLDSSRYSTLITENNNLLKILISSIKTAKSRKS